ncbi:hypothetical protein [Gordonia sp. ABSL49_1]|uniref:nuclear transport factor 2 family protein n=1 Tax=Gordonia sp. ABSL49_1 TaxID=2920941 RepID=UPI001F117528|nr:hypothetical protein [Gordonia sp. ABSL49_1]MCH5642163.1 hypothetical protein [Gordonia sp. ABSL49_1]
MWIALIVGIVIGLAVAMSARRLLLWALARKLRHGVACLAQGDIGPLAAGYHEDAVLYFHEGDHRWRGRYEGRAAIEGFLLDFVDAGLAGDICSIVVGGAPWSMTIAIRFDDAAVLDGEQIYTNRSVLWARARWGKIVEQRDFYEDSQRLIELDRRLPVGG